MTKAKFIEGGLFTDERGQISFVNSLNLSPAKRFYIITNKDTTLVRGWQGHRIERRWFFCIKGKFDIRLVKIDNFENPNDKPNVEKFILSEETSGILEIPQGYANGFRAIEENSKLLVFSDFELHANPNDEYRYEFNKWTNWDN